EYFKGTCDADATLVFYYWPWCLQDYSHSGRPTQLPESPGPPTASRTYRDPRRGLPTDIRISRECGSTSGLLELLHRLNLNRETPTSYPCRWEPPSSGTWEPRERTL